MSSVPWPITAVMRGLDDRTPGRVGRFVHPAGGRRPSPADGGPSRGARCRSRWARQRGSSVRGKRAAIPAPPGQLPIPAPIGRGSGFSYVGGADAGDAPLLTVSGIKISTGFPSRSSPAVYPNRPLGLAALTKRDDSLAIHARWSRSGCPASSKPMKPNNPRARPLSLQVIKAITQGLP